MASSSSFAQVGAPSWASVVAGENSELRFVEASKGSIVDGILKLPKEVLEVGVKKLKSAVVAQFLGKAPPIRVIRSMVNRLWGFEGEVLISVLSEGFFLFEFKSETLCDWVLARSWHIHHSAMVLRRWEKGISPIDYSPKEFPVWVVLKKVPPILINTEGISWLASQIGRPITKFVRDGLDIKVCVVKDVSEEMKTAIVVDVEEDECAVIELEVPQLRTYREVGSKKWIVRDTIPKLNVPTAVISSPGVPEAPYGAERGTDPQQPPGGWERSCYEIPTGGVPSRFSVFKPEKSIVDGDGVIVSEEEKHSDGAGDDEPFTSTSVRIGNATFGDFVSPKGFVTRRKKNRGR